MKTIGNIVKEFRQEMPGKVTQEQFGKLVGVPASVISDIERGIRTPSKQVAIELAKLTGMPLEVFIR